MIVSHSRRFIFVAVPRTGSQTVRAALRPHLGPADEEQAVWRTRKALSHPALAAIGHGHITAREAAAHLAPEAWEGYLTFAFVRDPWERFVSAAALVLGADPLFRTDPVTCLRLHTQSDAFFERLHLRPQVEFVLDAQGAPLVDVVGRVERYGADFAAVMERVGLKGVSLGHLHRSPPANRNAWRNPEVVQRVAEWYAADYAAFTYPLP